MNLIPVRTKCATVTCFMEAALLLDDIPRCVPCHRAANNGRVI